jgi:hypothetical protein
MAQAAAAVDQPSLPTDVGVPSTTRSTTTSHHQHHDDSEVAVDARFSCNICFDAVTEPVVTQCGHLFCWPCLYRWLAPGMLPHERASLGMPPLYTPLDERRRTCPVCKSQCSVPTIVPIYVRASSSRSGNGNDDKEKESPANQRTAAIQQERGGGEGGDVSSRHIDTSATAAAEEPLISPLPSTDDDDDDDHAMGLDIDSDDDDDDDTEVPVPTGLRQRRRRSRRQEEEQVVPASATAATSETTTVVPTRPAPSASRTPSPPPHRGTSATTSAAAANNNTAVIPHHHARASLSYGLVLAMHQALLNAANHGNPQSAHNNGNNASSEGEDTAAASSSDASSTEQIPSLHYPHLREPFSMSSSSSSSDTTTTFDSDPASALFLSRLLLGLSIFVLLCLLVF